MSDSIEEVLEKVDSTVPDCVPTVYAIGLPDEVWINYYKDTNMKVIARNGDIYQYGEKITA